MAQQHPTGSIMVVSDPFTYEASASRIASRLKADGRHVKEFVWETPSCSEQGVQQIQQATRGVDAIVAVGSGTINDSVKYASFLDGRDYSVFPTSPMNAYTTNTASVSFGGYKNQSPVTEPRAFILIYRYCQNAPSVLCQPLSPMLSAAQPHRSTG